MIIQKSLSEKKKIEIKNCLFTDVTLATVTVQSLRANEQITFELQRFKVSSLSQNIDSRKQH